MTTSASSLPDAIPHALRDNNLVVCLGPQIQQDANLPSLEALARYFVENVQLDCGTRQKVLYALKDHRLGIAFQILAQEIGQDRFRRAVSDQLSGDYNIPPELLALAEIRDCLRAVFTTSLVDSLFAKAFEGSWPSLDKPRLFYAQKRHLIFHLRGTVGCHRTWVLTEDQERREFAPHSLRGRLFGAIYSSHRLLLMGFPRDCPDLKLILRMLPEVSPSCPPEHFIAISECDRHDRRMLAGRGFRALGLPPLDLLRHLGSSLAPVARVATTVQCPYPGLESFTETDARLFFGRRVEISEAAALLGVFSDGEHRNWLAVEGPSGIGKSSFVSAGVVPALLKGFGSATQGGWLMARMRPGEHPLKNLARCTLGALRPSAHQEQDVSDLAQRLEDDPSALSTTISNSCAPDCAFLLVIDQLEEATTFSKTGERPLFASAIAETLDNDQFYLVTVMRTDLLPLFQEQLSPLADIANQRAQRYILPSISRVGLREAIVSPAESVSVRVKPDLIETILKQADQWRLGAGEPVHDAATSPSALPLVAYILRALWNAGAARDGNITIEEYRQLGGIEGALANSAELLFKSFDEQQKSSIKALFLGLTRVDTGHGTTRRTLRRNTAVDILGGGQEAERLLLRLSGRDGSGSSSTIRLVTIRWEGTVGLVDLVHESLLRAWPRCQQWIRENRVALEKEHALEQRQKQYSKDPEPELPDGGELRRLLEVPLHSQGTVIRAFQDKLIEQANRENRASLFRRFSAVSLLAMVAATFLVTTLLLSKKNNDLNMALDMQEWDFASALARESENAAVFEHALRPEDPQRTAPGDLARDANHRASRYRAYRAALEMARAAGPLRTLRGPGNNSEAPVVAFSVEALITASDRRVCFWNATNGDWIRCDDYKYPISELLTSVSGETFALVKEGHRTVLLDLQSKRVVVLCSGCEVRDIAISPDGTSIAFLADEGVRRLILDFIGSSRNTLLKKTKEAVAVAFTPDGSIAFADKHGSAWNILDKSSDQRGWEKLCDFGTDSRIHTMKFSEDSKFLAVAGTGPDVSVCSIGSATRVSRLTGHTGMVCDIAFSPSSPHLASSSWDENVILWAAEGEEWRRVAKFEQHEKGVVDLDFAKPSSNESEKTIFASAGRDNVTMLWQIVEGGKRSLSQPGTVITSDSKVAFGRGGRVVTIDPKGCIQEWSVDELELAESGGEECSLDGDLFTISADGNHVASFSSKNGLVVKDLVTHESHSVNHLPSEKFEALALSDIGGTLAANSPEGNISVWRAPYTEEPIRHALNNDVTPSEIATDGQGRLLVYGSLFLYDLQPSGGVQVPAKDQTFEAAVRSPWAPSMIAYGGSDDRVYISSATGEKAQPISDDHTSDITAVAFSSKNLMATASKDNTIIIWRWEESRGAFENLGELILSGSDPIRVAFSAEGDYLLAVDSEWVMRVWPMPDRAREMVVARRDELRSKGESYAGGDILKLPRSLR